AELAGAKVRPGEAVEFQPADATDLPFPDRSFDALVCQFGIMFFPDKEKSYREAHRVLSPGGHYLFSVWDAHRFNPAQRRTHELLAELFPDDPPRFYEVPFAYHRLGPIREAVSEVGFTDFRAAVLHIDKAVADPAAFARGIILGNPVVEQIRARSGDPERVVDSIAEMLRREYGARPMLPLQVIFFEATRPESGSPTPSAGRTSLPRLRGALIEAGPGQRASATVAIAPAPGAGPAAEA